MGFPPPPRRRVLREGAGENYHIRAAMTAEEAAGVANPGSPRRPCLRTSGGRGGAPGEAAHAAAGAEPGGRGLASGYVPDAAEG